MNDWQRFEKSDTLTLIKLFQGEETNPIDREDAFLALTFRFRGLLIDKFEPYCRRLGHNKDIAIEVISGAFEKYGKSKSFNLSKCDQSNIDDAFKGYLYVAARNKLADIHRVEERKKDGTYRDGSEKLIKEMPQDIDYESMDLENRMIHEELMSMPKYLRVVYLNYSVYMIDKTKMPRKLLKELREYLGGVKQTTIQAYKKDAFDRIAKVRLLIHQMKKSHG